MSVCECRKCRLRMSFRCSHSGAGRAAGDPFDGVAVRAPPLWAPSGVPTARFGPLTPRRSGSASFVWLNAFLGALHLLPAYPLENAGRVPAQPVHAGAGTHACGDGRRGTGADDRSHRHLLGILLPNIGWQRRTTPASSSSSSAHSCGPGSGLSKRGDTVSMATSVDRFLHSVAVGQRVGTRWAKASPPLQDDFPVGRACAMGWGWVTGSDCDALCAPRHGYVPGHFQRSSRWPSGRPRWARRSARLADAGMSLLPLTDWRSCGGHRDLAEPDHS